MTTPLASDMYLSSFTLMQQELRTTASAVQLTLTTFLLGLGVGQLFLGPLSDRLGRRPVLLVSLGVFTLAGVGTVFAPTIGVLIVLRTLQGVSGAACVVLSRAIAADLTSGAAMIRALSLIAMLVGLGPILAPPLGAFVAELVGWRGVLAVLALLAAAMLFLSWWFVPETLPLSQRHGGGMAQSMRMISGLLRNGQFMLLLAVYASAFAGLMAYIAASPFVGQVVLRMTPVEYAFAFAMGSAALLIANSVNAQLAGKFNPYGVLMCGTVLCVLSSATLLTLTLTSTLAIASFIGCAFVMVSGIGFIMPNASALALGLASSARGSGSALLGAAQFLLGGALSPLVGAWGEGTAIPMALTMLTAGLVSFAGSLVAVLQSRDPRRE